MSKPNAWAIYQAVEPGETVNTWLVPFYDDLLEVSDGSYQISNGLPQRWWVEENRKKMSPRTVEQTLQVLTHWGV